MNNKSKTRMEDDDGDFFSGPNQLEYFTKTVRIHQHDVFIDEPVANPSYYRRVVQMLLDASPEDTVVLHINSPGGYLSGLSSLMEAVKGTEAHTVAVLVGDVSSAASMLVMYCDSVCVTDSASMLAHNVSYSIGGKGNDIVAHTQHVAKTSERLVREAYEQFLSEKEIDELLNGREIYLDAEDIRARFESRSKYYADQQEEMQKRTAPVPPLEAVSEKPKKRTSKPKE